MAGVTLLAPRTHARIPPQETGWYLVRYAVLGGGTIARLEATFDIVTSLSEHQRRTLDGENLGRWPEPPANTRCRILTIDSERATGGSEFPQRELFPLFDRTAEGTWVVADARWWPGSTAHARLIGSDGRVLADRLFGDGIEYLQCDRRGNVWVGYFDEGIFGADGRKPIGAVGINCFSVSGEIVFPRDPNLWPLPQISDCYAMNVVEDAVWLCTYTDFPISRLGFDGEVRVWANDKIGAKLLAVDGDLAVLLGGYGDERRHGALLQLEQDTARRIGEFVIDIPVDDLRELPLAGSRGDTMHFVHGDTWSRLTVADVATTLQRSD